MQINLNPTVSGVSGSSRSGAVAPATSATQLQQQRDLTQFLVRSADLRDSLVDLDTLLSDTRRRPSRVASATSATLLGLTYSSGTVATRVSSAEVNAATTSFTPAAPEWQGLSSADPVVGGAYDGSDGDGTYTLRALNTGVHGVSNVDIEVQRPDTSVLETITVAATDPIDRVYSLANGLTVSFADGNFVVGDQFTIDVLTGLDETIDADEPFDGSGAGGPNFESGVSVGAGSFDVNGTTISVASDDSVNSVAAQITASGAGVSAVYAAASESFRLTQKSTGASQTIDLANDTSGFLAAVKVDPGIFNAGTGAVDEGAVSIDQVAALSSITSGNFYIDGTEISIDVAVDSLNAVVARMNSNVAQVRTSLTTGGQRLQLESLDKDASLTVDDGTSGFFTALAIQPQTTEAVQGGLAKRSKRLITENIHAIADKVQRVFSESAGLGLAAPDVEKLRANFIDVVEEASDELTRGNKPRFVVDFDFEANATAFELSTRDESSFRRSVDNFYVDFQNVLAGERRHADDGLLDRLVGLLNARISGLRTLLGSRGVAVDAFV